MGSDIWEKWVNLAIARNLREEPRMQHRRVAELGAQLARERAERELRLVDHWRGDEAGGVDRVPEVPAVQRRPRAAAATRRKRAHVDKRRTGRVRSAHRRRPRSGAEDHGGGAPSRTHLHALHERPRCAETKGRGRAEAGATSNAQEWTAWKGKSVILITSKSTFP